MNYLNALPRFAKEKNISLKDGEIDSFIENNLEELEQFILKLEKKEKINISIKTFNKKRKKELSEFIIDDIFMDEEIIKTMAVAYSITEDNETIPWIDINNKTIDITKNDLGILIKKGSEKVKDIYFKYRHLKDQVIKNEI